MFTPDDLAGIVDLFGAVTREELSEALSELAYRRGEADAVPEEAIEDALEAFALVSFEREDGTRLLAPGPAAFPRLPEGAEDLPYMLEVESRTVDREVVGRAAEKRLRNDLARALAADEDQRVVELLDVSYDLEAWAPVDLGGVRDRIDDAREETS